MTVTDASDFLSNAHAKKLLSQLVTADPIEESELLKAFDIFADWVTNAALVELWHENRIAVSWDVENQELRIQRLPEVNL
jgi:hypothetical protein